MAKYEIINGMGIVPEGTVVIEKNTFYGCTGLTSINVPAMKIEYYTKRLPWKLHRFIVELPAEKKSKQQKAAPTIGQT